MMDYAQMCIRNIGEGNFDVKADFECRDVSCSGADSIGHGGHMPPLLQMAGHRGHRE